MNHKLLVIDDDATLRDACLQILGRNPDYAVEAAVDGKTGIEAAAKFKPDVALVDLKLPGMGGIEIIQELRKIDPHLVPVIITGYPTVSSAVDAIKKGAYDFLPKPFTPDELRLVVKRALDKRRLELETLALRQEREAMQRHFVSLVSHELRTPLLSIQQYVNALEIGAAGPVAPKQAEIYGRMSARIEGLMGLIDRWLNLNQLKTGKLSGEMKPLPLRPLVQEAVDILRPSMSPRRIQVATDFPKGDLTVVGDAGYLKEMMVNLIGNAVKYNKEGGSVTVTAGPRPDGGVSIEVRDTGQGIPAEDLPRLFEEFFRGTGRDDRAAEGSGLGLSIVKQIVQLHKGEIAVSSKVGEGSVFTVTLPATNPG